jgi:L-fuconolactonase
MPPAPRVDAHTHIWELNRRSQPWIDPRSMSVLNQDRTFTELTTEVRAAGIDGVVLVQVLNDAGETDDFLWCGTDPLVRGVVGWTDLLSPDLDEALDALTEHPSGARLVGIRHQALAEADPADWLRRAADAKAFPALGRRGLPFDLMFRPEHLDLVGDVMRRHSDTTFVLDHGGKPPIAAGWHSTEAERWAELIAKLATAGNVVGKVSGLTTMADLRRWTASDLEPFVDHLLNRFGPDRLIFGSDWPVSLRAGSYRRTVDTIDELVGRLATGERDAVMGGTAVRTYGLR